MLLLSVKLVKRCNVFQQTSPTLTMAMSEGESSAPPAPPLPRPVQRHPVRLEHSTHQYHVEEDTPFVVRGDKLDNIEFEFPKPAHAVNGLPLRLIVGQYLGHSQASRASASKLFLILGRLRCLAHALQEYNAGRQTNSHKFRSYWRQHTLNLLSGFGYRAAPGHDTIRVAGLNELIEKLEALHTESITEARSLIDAGMITFDALGELFRPDVLVQSAVLAGNIPSVFRVTDAFYEEHATLFGSQRRFRVSLEFVVLVGRHFSVATFSEVFLAWSGSKTRSIAEFTYRPVLDSEKDMFSRRAEKVLQYGLQGPAYSAYSPDSFYIHSTRSRQNNNSSLLDSSAGSLSHKGGRVMIDVARGASFGHYPSQAADEPSLAIIELSRRYRQWSLQRQSSQNNSNGDDTLYIWDDVPPAFLITCWPALVGMSFTAKAWGHVLVDGLSPIDFQEHAFDRLLLSPERKSLIKAVVRRGCEASSQTQDLITGKQGGVIFLLHGAPGVGKTLTAEAVAEMLHKPLYYITMGELGVTPAELEQRLTDVLGLCAEWNAIALLDEADVFLETRGTSDLVRNAMVCVMLRILEYHPGILFLTTNRVQSLDPAFESRITVALRYEALDEAARLQIWKSQLSGVPDMDLSEDDFVELAKERLNGRQIKNAARLAHSVALDQGVVVDLRMLQSTVELTSLGRQNMSQDKSWERATTGSM